MRILNYPPQYGEVDLKEIGIGAHTDYEMFTLLVQHGDVQALQVLNSAGDWVQAPPIPGTSKCRPSFHGRAGTSLLSGRICRSRAQPRRPAATLD